jgi:hypothetical protein
MRLPDFIIGGAPRCGTTWLYAVADRHPHIEMAKPLVPEPKFFLQDELFDRGLEYYSKTWFAEIAESKLAGEKSANYLENANVADRMASCLPSVRLVFALRNPIDRAFSNYLWSKQNGLEDKSFDAALAFEEEREATVPEQLRYARPFALFSRGLYAKMLKPFFDRFERERILIFRYEDMVATPRDAAASLHRFLGVTTRPQDGEAQQRLNSAQGQSERMDVATRRRVAQRYEQANGELYALLGRGFQPWND